MRVWDRKIEDSKMGWGEKGEPPVPRLIALIFLSSIFLSHMDVVSIQGPGFSGLQHGGNASFDSQPDQHGLVIPDLWQQDAVRAGFAHALHAASSIANTPGATARR